jgi:hypothetical protein
MGLMLEGASPWASAAVTSRAPLAQLDRASVYGTEGYRFESCEVYSQALDFQGLASFGKGVASDLNLTILKNSQNVTA